jgi:hypothetical protein
MIPSTAVIPANAGIQFDRDLAALKTSTKSKMDSRFCGNDGNILARVAVSTNWQPAL